jgi:hypothetical protein
MKRWELRFLRFHNTCPGILDKDTAVIIGGITGIVTETILTLAIMAIEVGPAMSERSRAIIRVVIEAVITDTVQIMGAEILLRRYPMKCKMSIEGSASGVIMDKALSRVREDFIIQ